MNSAFILSLMRGSFVPRVRYCATARTEASGMEKSGMTALDSQLPDTAPSSRFQVRDTRPSQLDDTDPFSSVRKKRDV